MADLWLNDAFDLLTGFEGFSSKPYWDVNAWRIGYGSDTITRADGTVERVTQTSGPITKPDAGRDLSRRIPEFTQTVIGQIGQDAWDKASNKAKGAYLSAAYNYGSLPGSLVTTIKNGGDAIDVAVGLAKLGTNKGINNPGRRGDEAAYSLKGMVNTQMADNDAFSSAFGGKPTTAAKPIAPVDTNDAFSSAFGGKPAPTTATPAAVATSKPAAVAPAPDAPINFGKLFGAQGTQVKRYVEDVVKSDPSLTPAAVLADPTHQQAIIQRVPQAKAVFNKDFADYLDKWNAKGNSALFRGFQDVGDTAAWAGGGAAVGGAKVLGAMGVLPQSTAGVIETAVDANNATNTKGREAWEKDNPATFFGPVPTDSSSWLRLFGQGVAAGPVTGRAALGGKWLAEKVATNPLVKTMITGGTIGGTQAATVVRGSDTPPGEQIAAGAVLGSLFGPATQVVWHAGRTIAEKLFGKSPVSEKSLAIVNSWFDKLGLSVDDADAIVKGLGPDATYADIDEALRVKAAGLATKGGETTSILDNAFKTRGETGGARTQQAVTDAIGGDIDPALVVKRIEDAASTAGGPHYDAAKASGAKLDAAPVITFIDDALKTAKGGTATALNKAKALLYTKDAAGNMTLDDSIELLHSARIEMDNEIARLKKNPDDTTATDRAIGAMQDVRKQLDNVLKTNPDMKAGDEVYAAVIQTKNSFEFGQNVLKNSTSKEALEKEIAKATPAQVIALKGGARAAIFDALENAAQGEQSAAQSLFGKKSANREKLRLLFPNEADAILDMVEANAAMRRTENQVRNPSATAKLTEAQKEFSPQPGPGDHWATPLIIGGYAAMKGGAETGLAATAAMRMVTATIERMRAAGMEVTARDVARILATASIERKDITNALAKNVKWGNRKTAYDSLAGVATRGIPGTVQEGQRSPDRANNPFLRVPFLPAGAAVR